MSILEGADFSFSPPTGAELRAAGKRFAVTYITPPGPGEKGISQARYDDLDSHGIAVAFVWEAGTDAVLAGRLQGVADAKNAQANLTVLKGPSNRRPLYFAIDFQIQPAQYPLARAYFQGVNSVIGVNRTGAYGHANVLRYLTQQKVINKRFLTYAWSAGQMVTPLDLYQYSNDHPLGSGTVDYVRAYSRNWGQKAVLIAKPAPRPVYYTARTGDTLTVIAEKYHTSVPAILHLNRDIANPNVIYAGQRIRIR